MSKDFDKYVGRDDVTCVAQLGLPSIENLSFGVNRLESSWRCLFPSPTTIPIGACVIAAAFFLIIASSSHSKNPEASLRLSLLMLLADAPC